MSTPDPTGHDRRVNEAIADYLEAVEAGRAPTTDELLSRHPDIAAELKAFLADHEQFKQFASPVGPVAGAVRPDNDRRDEEVGAARTLVPGQPSPADGTLGTVRYFGDYELLQEIARGGMGVVYKARQT